jgi:hypothetical protein
MLGEILHRLPVLIDVCTGRVRGHDLRRLLLGLLLGAVQRVSFGDARARANFEPKPPATLAAPG